MSHASAAACWIVFNCNHAFGYTIYGFIELILYMYSVSFNLLYIYIYIIPFFPFKSVASFLSFKKHFKEIPTMTTNSNGRGGPLRAFGAVVAPSSCVKL